MLAPRCAGGGKMEEEKCNHEEYYVHSLYFSFLDRETKINIVDLINQSISDIIRNQIEDIINTSSYINTDEYREKWPYDIKVILKCFCQKCNKYFEKTETYNCCGDVYFTCKRLYRNLINSLLVKYTNVELSTTYVFFDNFDFLQDIFEYRNILKPLIDDDEKNKLEKYENAYISAPREFGGEPLDTIINSLYAQIAIGLLTNFIWEISKYGILKIKNSIKPKKIENRALKKLNRLLNECEQIQNRKQRKEAKKKVKALIKYKSNEIYRKIMSL